MSQARHRKHKRRNGAKTVKHQTISIEQLDNIRAIAAAILNQVVSGQKSLNTILPQAANIAKEQDFSLLQEMVYGSCRWYFYLQHIYQQYLNKPLSYKDTLTDCCLIVGAYQLIYMRTPSHAAINETVNAAEELGLIYHKGMINAVLRRISEKAEGGNLLDGQADEQSYPTWIKEKLKHNWPEQWQSLLHEGNQRPPMTIRVNSSYKQSKDSNPRSAYLKQLHESELEAKATEFSPLGITLDKAQAIDALPDFEHGASSIQDEAAQLCCQLMELSSDLKVLDACAAPGGKTCALLEQEPSIQLTALDSDETRSQRIYENLERLKLKAKVVVAPAENLEQWWDNQPFDRILLDAPCSASGVIRRHPDIKLLRKEEDIKALAEVQMNLLSTLWKTLLPGGKLVYATCSVFPQENSRIIERFLKQEESAELEPIKANWGLDTGFGRQLFPRKNGHDGFFYACLTKREV